jgi:hypothetical protein
MSTDEYTGPHRICNLAADALAAENLELRDRCADLESERETYREIATVALERCHYLTELVRVQKCCLNKQWYETWARFIVETDRDIEDWIRREKHKREQQNGQAAA